MKLDVAAVLALFLFPFGQAIADRANRTEVAAEMRPLHTMAGNWDVHERLEMAGGAEGKGRAEGRLGPGGHSIIMDYATVAGPMTGFRIHEIVTWNPDDRKYRIVFVDGFNAGVSIASGVKQGEEIVLERHKTAGNHSIVSRSILAIQSPDKLVLASSVSQDGGPFKKTLTLTFTRRSP